MAAPVALAAGVLSMGSETVVVVRGERGESLVREELPRDGRFALRYVHSYYRAPAEERFSVDGSGFRLESLASPRAAVLDYYALEGHRARDGRRLRLFPRAPRRYRRLPLIATSQGRRTLVVGGRRTPLFGSNARHLTIAVERRSPLDRWAGLLP